MVARSVALRWSDLSWLRPTNETDRRRHLLLSQIAVDLIDKMVGQGVVKQGPVGVTKQEQLRKAQRIDG
jgi:hypothetical protein